MIDQASVFAERYKNNPQILQASVLGHGGDPHLDPYTALRALQLIKETNQMAMARQAQQPTSAPSLLSDAMTPPQPPAMPMGAPVAQGQPTQGMPQGMPQRPMPQAPVMQAFGGLAAMHVPEEHYAGGGILAFASRGLVDGKDEPYGDRVNTDDDSNDGYIPPAPADNQTQGSQSALDALNDYILDYLRNKSANAPPPTSAELSAMRAQFLKEQEDYAGPDIHGPAQADQVAREEARKANMGQMSGLALLNAAGAVLKGHSLGEGISNAAPAYAGTMGEAIRADQAEKRSIEQMNFALADAKRKERMGNFRAANEAMENYRKSVADANRAKTESDRADALLAGRAAAANRMPAKGAGQAPTNVQLVNNIAAEYISKGMSPVAANARATRELLAAQGTKAVTSNITSGPPAGGPTVENWEANRLLKAKEDAAKNVDANLFRNSEYVKAAQGAHPQGLTTDQVRSNLIAVETQRLLSTQPSAPRGGGSAALPSGFVPDQR